MMTVEVRDDDDGGCGIDPSPPSDLHWKKELTQIRMAARVLRDPATSFSSWRSPVLGSARSPTVNNGHVGGNAVDRILQVGTSSSSFNNENAGGDKGNSESGEKERRKVYLCNWRSQKSESEMSRQIGEGDVENDKDEGLETDSICNVRSGGRNDSKSDGYFSDRFTMAIFKCMDSSFTPSIRRTRKKKLKRSKFSSSSSGHQKKKMQTNILLSRYMRNVVDDYPCVRLGRDDFLSLNDQSDDNGDHCNSEDLGRDSAISHLFARLKSKGWSFPPSKMMSHGKEDDSVSNSTQALSTSSFNRYALRNASAVESWVATTRSLDDDADEVDGQLDLPGRHGCGIPCYWSRRSTPRSRNGSSCSPSLSDTLRRKGSSFFCGSQTMTRRRHYSVSLGSNKRRLNSKKAAQGLVPLLDCSADGLGGSSMRSRDSDDELSAKFSEFYFEALSHLVGRRWSSSCKSQEGLELVALNGEVQKENSPENVKSLSHKYRPLCFEELIGQNIVVQSLISAISRRRIAPFYLFQGPRGVGKTSMARVFSGALNCLATEDSKPCVVCRECADFISGNSRFLEEVDGSNKKGVDQLRNILKNISAVHSFTLPHYKVIVIEQCQLLPPKTWLTLMRLLDKPYPFIVFILITTEGDNIPRTILTRCQKLIFNKISNGDIVTRLRKISIDENLDVDSNALELIASNADGSLREAETMLDQLSLFGKRITKSLVNELMGVVSEDKLLELLELAMSSNVTDTVRKSGEVMDSGVDPLVLISQLVTLIVDIIAGTCPSVDAKQNNSFFGGRTLTERELDRLKRALSLLSEAEKHLSVSSEQSAWFTATLLQIGSSSPTRTQSTSSRRWSFMATVEDCMSMPREPTEAKQNSDEQSGSSTSFTAADHCNSSSKEKIVRLTPKTNESQFIDGKMLTVSHNDCIRRTTLACEDSEMLTDIWLQCIEKCHSKKLRLLLHSYGKLVLISETKGGFIAHVAFKNSDIKTRAEGFLSSITNSLEVVLRHNVEVKLSLLQDSLDPELINRIPVTMENRSTCSNATGVSSDFDQHQDPLKISRKSFDTSQGHQKKGVESVLENAGTSVESIIHQQGLETGCLQALDKGTPGSMSHSRPERNQVLPQDGPEATNSLDGSITEDELIHVMKTLKMNQEMAHQKDQAATELKSNLCPTSHKSPFAISFSQDNMGYESGSGGRGCSGMLCWNNPRGKAKKGTPTHAAKRGRFSLFGDCAKSRTDNRR